MEYWRIGFQVSGFGSRSPILNFTARFAQDAKDAKNLLFIESGNCLPKRNYWQFTIRQHPYPWGWPSTKIDKILCELCALAVQNLVFWLLTSINLYIPPLLQYSITPILHWLTYCTPLACHSCLILTKSSTFPTNAAARLPGPDGGSDSRWP